MKPRVRVRNGKPVYQLIVQEPVPELIEHIEKLLVMAKKGEMRAMIEVLEWDDGAVSDGWNISGCVQRRRLMGALFEVLTTLAFSETVHAEVLYDD